MKNFKTKDLQVAYKVRLQQQHKVVNVEQAVILSLHNKQEITTELLKRKVK